MNIMRLKKCLTIVLLLFNMASAVSQSFDLKEVDSILNIVLNDDRQIRIDLIDAHKNNLTNVDEIIMKMNFIDSCNQQYVSKLLDNYGWADSLSENAHEAIWLVIDHANNQFSEKYFPLAIEKGEQGILPMSDVVTLEDRLLMRNGKKQKFGTQTVGIFYTNNKENIIYIWPIEDNEKVDELRKAVGLPPMEQYIHQLEDDINCKVVFDKDLSIDDLKEKLPLLFSK